MKNRDLVVLLLIVALVVLLLILLLMYFFKWKKEGSKMLPNKNGGASSTGMGSVQHKEVPNVSLNSQGVERKDKEIPTASNSQREQRQDDLTVIDHMTLEDTLRILKSDNVLSELDNDLKDVKAGKRTIENHKEYFKTQVDKKLTQLCKKYHPNSPKWHSIPEEERPKAQAIQAKLDDIRSILKHFNENFSQCDNFKYSYFSKVRVDFLGNKEKLKNITYTVLNKLGELSHIKYERLVPDLNGFLRSSQASMKGFISNNVDHFQKEKDNAECYFQSYLIGYEELRTNLELFCDLCKENDRMEPIATQMLEECKTQGKILNKVSGHLINHEYSYCINDKRSYEQAEKDFTLPFIEYTNILAICNEIVNTKRWRELVSNETIYKTVADNKVIRNLNSFLSLHELSHYLVTYYCYGNEENGKLAAKLLHINSLDKEHALQLLVQIINVYSNYLEKEFQPEKDFYEKVAEVQMNFLRTMKNLGDEFCKDLRQYNEQLYEVHLERNEVVSEMCEQIREQGEFYKQASESCRQDSEFLIGHLEREEAASAEREERLKKMIESVKEQRNKLSCSSSSQQQPANQADDQPDPSSELSGVQPISRSQSLDSSHSNDSDVEIISRSQCR